MADSKIEYSYGDILRAIRRDVEAKGYKTTSVEIKLIMLSMGHTFKAMVHVKPKTSGPAN